MTAFYKGAVIVFPAKNCLAGSTLIGTNAGNSISSGTPVNTFMGSSAGEAITSASTNVGVGGTAMQNAVAGGAKNTFVGAFSGRYICGNNNTGIGFEAIHGTSLSGASQAANGNTAVGACALRSVTTGNCNTAIGFMTLHAATVGIGNIGIGHCNSVLVTNGSCNIGIGALASMGASDNRVIMITSVGLSSPCIWSCSDRVGICTISPGTALHIVGGLVATGEITAYYSDRRLKENITPIKNALEKIKTINGVTYQPNQKAIEFGFEELKSQVGVLADEVEKVFPELIVPAPFDVGATKVSKSGDNYKTVKYEKFVPVLVEAIKELKLKAEDLRSQIKILRKENQN